MAALTAPARTAPKHQSLLHFIANAPWSDEAVLTKVRQMVLPKIEALGAVEASIVDDTGFPKKGNHSVGVARQYCGQVGKQDNCQARRLTVRRQRSRQSADRPPALSAADLGKRPGTADPGQGAKGHRL
jgi:SRSO17 transposase